MRVFCSNTQLSTTVHSQELELLRVKVLIKEPSKFYRKHLLKLNVTINVGIDVDNSWHCNDFVQLPDYILTQDDGFEISKTQQNAS